jgi:hypothetical protein
MLKFEEQTRQELLEMDMQESQLGVHRWQDELSWMNP